MVSIPDLLFIVDVRREETAIHEANLLKIPVIALVDTNCDPTNVDYVIPSNDDAIRAIKLMTSKIADAILEGLAIRKDEEEEEAELLPLELDAGVEIEMTDEELLGEATLAKLHSGAFDEKTIGGDEEPVTEEAELSLEEDEEEDQLLELGDEEPVEESELQDTAETEATEADEEIEEEEE